MPLLHQQQAGPPESHEGGISPLVPFIWDVGPPYCSTLSQYFSFCFIWVRPLAHGGKNKKQPTPFLLLFFFLLGWIETCCCCLWIHTDRCVKKEYRDRPRVQQFMCLYKCICVYCSTGNKDEFCLHTRIF